MIGKIYVSIRMSEDHISKGGISRNMVIDMRTANLDLVLKLTIIPRLRIAIRDEIIANILPMIRDINGPPRA